MKKLVSPHHARQPQVGTLPVRSSNTKGWFCMPKILITCLSSVLLLPVLLAITACSPKQVCLSKAALTLTQSALTHELSSDSIDVAAGCIDAFTQSPGSQSTQVELNTASDDSTFTTQVTSDVIYNCNSYQVSGQYDFNIPFVMVVGTDQQSTEFTTLPAQDQSSDVAQIANELYNRDNIGHYFTKSDTPSGGYDLTAPPQSETRLVFSVTIHYKYGIGRVDTNGNAGDTQVWLYDFSFDPPGTIPVHWQPVESQYC